MSGGISGSNASLLVKAATGCPAVYAEPTAPADELTAARDVNITWSSTTSEDNSRLDDGWGSVVVGLNTWGLSFDMLNVIDNAQVEVIKTAYKTRTPVCVASYEGVCDSSSSGNVEVEGLCYVTGMDKAEPLDGVQVYSVTLEGIGKPNSITSTP